MNNGLFKWSMDALIFAIMLILIVVGLTVVGYGASAIFYDPDYVPRPCQYPKSMACIQERFDDCMVVETFSRNECIIIVGGN